MIEFASEGNEKDNQMTSPQNSAASNREGRDERLEALYSKLDDNDMAAYWAVDSDSKNDEDGGTPYLAVSGYRTDPV